MKTYCFSLLASALIPLSAIAQPLTNSAYNYNVFLLPPFGHVIINGNSDCPNPEKHQVVCPVKNQPVGSTITITGLGEHVCYLTVQTTGALVIASPSVFCGPELKLPRGNNAGEIHLPPHF